MATNVISQKRIELKNLPMPPTANALYSSGRFSNKSRRWKSEAYTLYLSKMGYWTMQNKIDVELSRNIIRQWLNENLTIKIDSLFYFKHQDLWTKPKSKRHSPRPQQLDASNRIKALHDVLAQMLCVDDRYFWGGYFEKIESDKQHATVILTAHTPQKATHESTFETGPNPAT